MDWTNRLRLRHLQILVSLAETQNISHSAERLHMTQPALSKWLKELEADGVIARTLHPQVPPRVEYALSPLGIALLPLLQQMHDLALSHAELLAQSGDGPGSPAIEPG